MSTITHRHGLTPLLPLCLTHLFCVIASMIALFGCGHKSDIATNAVEATHKDLVGSISSIHGMSDLRQLLVEGLVTNDIIARLGLPNRITAIDGGMEKWQYDITPFRADNIEPATYVEGLTIVIRYGRLTSWGCSYSRVRPNGTNEEIYTSTSITNRATNIQNVARLEFFVVNERPIAGGHFVDSEVFPRLGFIAPTPDLEIERLRRLIVEDVPAGIGSQNSNAKWWVLKLSFSQIDAQRFESLTSDNVGKTLLMVVDGQPCIKVPIHEAVAGGNVEFSTTNQSGIGAIRLLIRVHA